MPLKIFRALMRWELEEYLSFPVVEFLVASMIFLTFFQPLIQYGFESVWENLNFVNIYLVIFLILLAGTIFSRSFAGSLDRNEIKLLLSYPIKRWMLFVAKFFTLFFVLSAIYLAVFSVNIPLLGLSPFEPMFFASALGLLLHLLVVCNIATTISLLVKKETITVLVTTISLFGLETITGENSALSGLGRSNVIFDFFKQSIVSVSNPVAFQDFVFAIILPVLISVFLFLFSLVYFSYVMEVD